MRRTLIAVEMASIEFGNPDPDQMATKPVPLGQRIQRLSAQKLLDDLPFEFDRMRTVPSHRLSPRKPGSVSRFAGLYLSTPRGALQSAQQFIGRGRRFCPPYGSRS